MIEITLIRNKYPLWLREKKEGSKWLMLEDIDNTTTLGMLTNLVLDKTEQNAEKIDKAK